MTSRVDGDRLLARLRALGGIGRDGQGRLMRLAGSDADKAGRDQLAAWMAEAGLELAVDAVGNMFGTWQAGSGAPVMIGSHIDSVIDAGIYDGSYGVLAGLAVVEALRAGGHAPARPLVVAAFTNEEGVRYAPDMMGSLVHAGGLPVADALAAVGTDGSRLGEELARIGYAGSMAPGTIRPAAYLELHVEQGPVLEEEGAAIGAVESLQGISWQRVMIEGAANHAGTTPMRLRRDAGHAAARVVTFLHDLATAGHGPVVATVGTLHLEPGAINVIPGRASLTIDLRDPDETRLRAAEDHLAGFLEALAAEERVRVDAERLARFAPVAFDPGLVGRIEAAARQRALKLRRMTSGAGHDAQMMARICPAAMIFVPSRGGVSHSPLEHTAPDELTAGADVLLDVVRGLT
jgi:N-carbamoyl-L-amino-acid hydrolase